MSKNKLITIADKYEKFVLSNWTEESFYRLVGDTYESFVQNITKDLTFIGSGQCCQVYKLDDYVVKIHTPYGEKIKFDSYPTLEDLEICKNHKEACAETGWRSPLAVKYFLFADYITEHKFAAVQRLVDASEEARRKAYRLFGEIDPYLQRWNHMGNMAMDGKKPVYIDWD